MSRLTRRALRLLLPLIAMAAAWALVLSRAQPRQLPDLRKYRPDQMFELGACDYYVQVPYMSGWYEGNGVAGYCSVTNALPWYVSSISLYMHGDTITSASIKFTDAINVQSFLEAWGKPKLVRNWRYGMQVVWSHAIVYLSKGRGGGSANAKITYVYIY